nr:MAG TPA_asm: hypothetical protein [Caudoviricetes sp.]
MKLRIFYEVYSVPDNLFYCDSLHHPLKHSRSSNGSGRKVIRTNL